MYIDARIFVCTNIHRYIYVGIFAYVHMFVYVCTYVYACIDAYMVTCIYVKLSDMRR